MKKKMKKAFLVLLSVCMVMTMMPAAAFAAETDTPSAASISISSASGQTYTSSVDGAAKRLVIPNDAVLDIASIGMTTTEAVTLGNVSASGTNTIYADGENLMISLNVKGAPYTITAQMNSEDGINWTGEGDVQEIEGVTDLPIGALVSELGNTDISVAEGVLTADGRDSVAARIGINQDAEDVYLYLYPASAETHTVTYNYGTGSYTFTMPDGTQMVDVQVSELTGQTFSGWYTDAECTIPAVFDTVTDDVILYGSYIPQAGVSDFDSALTALLDGDSSGLVNGALPISDVDDFEAFVSRASEVPEGQLVQLQSDLTLTDKTYSAISNFKGDFDGNQKTITGASFTVVNGNAGMFATLGAGQVVANLRLDNINVYQSSATYSGILVGSASGTESAGDKQVTIQNIQVSDSSVRGRSAGGIAGFILWTDIRYCSVTGDEDMEIVGTVNAGGIAGISYNNITDCYTKVTPETTLPILNDIGGIVGKNLDNAAHINHCWCTYESIAGQIDNKNIVINYLEDVDRGTDKSEFEELDFDETYWVLEDGTDSHFTDAITYNFSMTEAS